jgi:hypothetical protein
LGAIEDAIDEFVKDPAKFILNGLLKLVGIPPDAFWALVAKIQKVVKDVAADPMSFANNLMAGIGQGFQQFFDNIGQHLIKGMLEWLLSGMKDAGLSVAVPRDFSMRSVVMFFLDLLGISWPRIRMLLVEQLGEKTVAILETAGGAIAAVMTKGLSGIWEEIQQMLEPKVIIDAIIDAAIKYITETVIVKVAARIIAMLNPAGAILAAVEAIYRVLKWIFNNAARIFRLVEAVVNGMADVIAGNIQGVANMVENALGMLIAPVIDFIADYIGLGGLPAKVADAVKGLQAWVEGILRKVIAWLVAQGKKLLAALGIGKKKDEKPDERTAEQKQADLDKALAEADTVLRDPEISESKIPKKLGVIKKKYKMADLSLVIDQNAETKERGHVHGSINPEGDTPVEDIPKEKTAEEAHNEVMAKMSSSNKTLLKGHGDYIVGHAGRNFSIATNDAVDEIGYTTGDHSNPSIKTPGTKGDPRTKYGKLGRGNWIPDHQPPDTLLSGGASISFHFYPHSNSSRLAQGGAVRVYKMWMKEARKRGDSDWAEGVQSDWFW